MGKLILVRHGKSAWNVQNLFTGWTDVDLAPEGIKEAIKAGQLIKNEELAIDICISSYLKRAIKTVWVVLVSAHGNSLRALIERIKNIPPSEIVELEILTGIPYIYEFDNELNLLGHHQLK